MSLLVDEALLAAAYLPGLDQLATSDQVHQVLMDGILRSAQLDPIFLGRATRLASQAADVYAAYSDSSVQREIIQIFARKITQCLDGTQSPLVNQELNQIITQLFIELENSAVTDPLTRLYNRGYLERRLMMEVSRARRHSEQPFCLLMFDIDYFKRFNDTYGHNVGDDVLRVVANLTQEVQRKSDIIARYGGEEFCCILIMTRLEAAQQVAERLRQKIADFPFVVQIDKDGEMVPNTVPIHISVGVTEFRKGDTSLSLIKRADKALYRAKENGRNRVEIGE